VDGSCDRPRHRRSSTPRRRPDNRSYRRRTGRGAHRPRNAVTPGPTAQLRPERGRARSTRGRGLGSGESVAHDIRPPRVRSAGLGPDDPVSVVVVGAGHIHVLDHDAILRAIHPREEGISSRAARSIRDKRRTGRSSSCGDAPITYRHDRAVEPIRAADTTRDHKQTVLSVPLRGSVARWAQAGGVLRLFRGPGLLAYPRVGLGEPEQVGQRG
jgi:hypothetical protein